MIRVPVSSFLPLGGKFGGREGEIKGEKARSKAGADRTGSGDRCCGIAVEGTLDFIAPLMYRQGRKRRNGARSRFVGSGQPRANLAPSPLVRDLRTRRLSISHLICPRRPIFRGLFARPPSRIGSFPFDRWRNNIKFGILKFVTAIYCVLEIIIPSFAVSPI